MTDFIDDWINQLGQTTTSTQQTPHPAESLPIVPQPRFIEETPEGDTSTQELSDNDLNSILNELGFAETQEAEAEEIIEEEEEEEGNEEEADHLAGNDTPAQVEQAASSVDSHAMAAPSSQETLLPPNSPTLLMDDSTSRFSGTEWFSELQEQRVIIAGCGGIGSWLSLNIARLHPQAIFLYDDDTVEQANLSGQLFSTDDVGKNKTDAVSKMIRKYTSLTCCYSYSNRFNENTEAGPIMMCGFDNMEARRTYFNSWVHYVQRYAIAEDRTQCLFLDGRLSIDTLQIFCIRGDDTYNMERYLQQHLFSDQEADETICSMKQTTYLACMIGSLMTNLFVNHVANLLDPVLPYDLPFFTEYDAQNMIFKTES